MTKEKVGNDYMAQNNPQNYINISFTKSNGSTKTCRALIEGNNSSSGRKFCVYQYVIEEDNFFDGSAYVTTNITIPPNIVYDSIGNSNSSQTIQLRRAGILWNNNYNINNNKIYIDTIAPEIIDYSKDGAVYKQGELMNWNITFSEPISKGNVIVRYHDSPDITTNANEITTNAGNYQSNRMFNHTVKAGENNYRELYFYDYTDKAGNELVDSRNWKAPAGYENNQCADTTPPELTISHTMSGNIVNYNFTLSDNSSVWRKTNGQLMTKAGIASNSLTISDVILANGTIISHAEDNNGNLASLEVLINGEGKQILYIKEGAWSDAVGNKALASEYEVIIDTKPPHIYNVDKSPCTWTNGDVQLTVFAEDEGYGIDAYSFDDGQNWQTENIYTVSENKQIKIQVRDKGGSIATQIIEVDNIDKTIPILELNKQENDKESAKIIIRGSDNESGIAGCSINGIDVTLERGNYQFTTTQNGTYTVTIYDKAGNSTTKTIDITNIDTSGIPNATIMYLINGGDYILNPDFKAKLTEEVVVTNVSVRNIDYTWTDSEQEPQTWENNSSDMRFRTEKEVDKAGEYYLHVKVTDTNGKVTKSHSNAFCVKEFPIKIDDSIVTEEIDGTRYIILPKETESRELLEKITSEKYIMKIKDAEGTKDNTGKIRTGDVLYIEAEEGNFKLYKICVLGDVNKDGLINIIDIFQVNQRRLEKVEFDIEQLISADVNRDKNVNIDDIFRMNQYRLEIIESF